ncbi:MAG TPA: D-tyrosyl-tRNA(Tyr) deacylase [Phycisphaerales bacterium]|nr:D-tyrosyl-tRNA(Tyr) deacylase [Phycisphaerales bacterium]
MRAVVQKVANASVTVEGEVVGAIDKGFMILLGVTHDDTEEQAAWLAKKVSGLRIFEDDDQKMNLSLLDVGGDCLVVSQFTLYGDCKKGRRPSFVDAARPEHADKLYQVFCERLRETGCRVETGRFQTFMKVSLVNDGPVTLILDTP